MDGLMQQPDTRKRAFDYAATMAKFNNVRMNVYQLGAAHIIAPAGYEQPKTATLIGYADGTTIVDIKDTASVQQPDTNTGNIQNPRHR
jgi:hypothetical protein